MLKRHEIKVLLKAGHTQTDVASLAGVSRRSVQRVALEGAIAAPVEDQAARQARGIGRPSLVGDFRKFAPVRPRRVRSRGAYGPRRPGVGVIPTTSSRIASNAGG